jgi:hypothetical protein
MALIDWYKKTSGVFKAIANILIPLGIIGTAILWANGYAQNRMKAVAHDTACIVVDSTIAPIKEDIKALPEIKEEVNQMDMRSKLTFHMQLRKMSLQERDAAIEAVLKIDTSIKRAEIYKEIYGTNYH